MRYGQIVHGTFVRRLNRFMAEAAIDGQTERVHVKNTGRLRELLVPGATVSLQVSDNPVRKTRHSLIAVKAGDDWVNIDSQAPNAVVEEALKRGLVAGWEKFGRIKREAAYGRSRFDFYVEDGHEQGFIEVKGVTLAQGGIALFPDAPTERGTKHVQALADLVDEGYRGLVLFLIQRKGCRLFRPHREMDAAFADALRTAVRRGVEVAAYDASVSDGEMAFGIPVPVDV